MNLTPWFPGQVKPARPGVYEREYAGPPGGPWFSEWTGAQWLSPARTPLVASKQVTRSFTQDSVRWRGLTEAQKS